MEGLGKSAVKAGNIAVEGDNALVQGTGNVAGAVDKSGALDTGMSVAKSARQNLFGGGLGDKLYSWIHGSEEEENARILGGNTKVEKKGNMPTNPYDGPEAAPTNQNASDITEAVKNGVIQGMASQKGAVIQNNNKVNVRVHNGDGSVSNKTHK
jgi:hypothetical protein